jgi:hypothetical protein
MGGEQAFNQWFGKQSVPIEALARALQIAIEVHGKDLSKSLAWGFPCWSGNERVLSIIAYKGHCNLQIWYGAKLADRFTGRIEGSGKSLRHVKIRKFDDIDGEVSEIIKAAIELDASDPQKVR